ncbi:hypothetical protein Patl1_25434 [Pistacia atlantica]|uniref:Uncharacterized protein n=1 Tax=Pistacia atlantica TaxID=434234 RepID=A0ACC1B258_9ROSI|nr:hypothetical protein Patl1_25434 [Pistacia atlantica]
MDDDEDPVARCLGLEQTIQQHLPHFSMSKVVEEKAKELEFLYLSRRNQEESTGREDSVHSTQNLIGIMIKQEQFLKYLTTILLTPKKAKVETSS